MFEDSFVDYMDCFKEAYKTGFKDGVEIGRKNAENALAIKHSESMLKWMNKLLQDPKPKTAPEGAVV